MGDHQNSHVKLDKEHIEHTDFREMPKMSYFSLFFFFFWQDEGEADMGGGH